MCPALVTGGLVERLDPALFEARRQNQIARAPLRKVADPADVAALRPFFDALAARTTRMGACGSGQMTKLCNNMLVATNVLAIAEMMAVARKAGIDVDALSGALSGGWADSKPLQIFRPRIAARQFEPRLGAIEVMTKDIRLARAMAAAAAADTPLLDRVLSI